MEDLLPDINPRTGQILIIKTKKQIFTSMKEETAVSIEST